MRRRFRVIDPVLFARYRELPRDVRCCLANRRLRSNVNVLGRLHRLYPALYPLAACLYETLSDRGRTAEAMSVWRRIVQRDPRGANPYYAKALRAFEKRQFNPASQALRQCLRRDTGYFRESAMFMLAECWLRLGQPELARRILSEMDDEYFEYAFAGHKVRSKQDMLKEITSGEQD